jgi:hypothetical protein
METSIEQIMASLSESDRKKIESHLNQLKQGDNPPKVNEYQWNQFVLEAYKIDKKRESASNKPLETSILNELTGDNTAYQKLKGIENEIATRDPEKRGEYNSQDGVWQELKNQLSSQFSLLIPTSTEKAKSAIKTIRFFNRASIAVRENKEYQEKVNNKLKMGDAIQTVTISPCPNVDMSKSPYEVFRRVYEERVRDTSLPEPDPSKIFSEYMNNPKYFKDSEESNSWMEGMRQDIRDYWEKSTGQGGQRALDPNLFTRGDRLSAGTNITLDMGTSNGTYGKESDVADALNTNDRKKIASLLESKVNVMSPPHDIHTLMTNTIMNEDDWNTNPAGSSLGGKIAAKGTDGYPIGYDFPGLDSRDKPGSREAESLSSEDIDRVARFALASMGKELEEFNKEYELLKEEHHKGNILYKMKPTVLKSFFTAAGILESYKWAKIAFEIKNTPPGQAVASVANLYHKFHSLGQLIGVVETFLGIYKTLTAISNGKPGDAMRDFGFTVLGAISEVAPKALFLDILFPSLTRAGATGVIGLALTTLTTYIDYVMKPFAQRQNEEFLNRILDLERMWLEKECCTKIHPGVYRNTQGQVLIPLVKDENPNSITKTMIPAGSTYKRGFEPYEKETKISMPCDHNGQINAPHYIGLRIEQSVYIDPNASATPTPIGKPIDVFVPKSECDAPSQPNGPEPTIKGMSSNDIIPGWSAQRELSYQNVILSYNTLYVQNEFQAALDRAKCRAGLIPEGGGNGYIDPTYNRGDRIPLDTGGRVRLKKSQLIEPLGRERKTTEYWQDYWTKKYGDDTNEDVADRIRRRGNDYGGGRGSGTGKKPSEGEDLGDVPGKV